MASSLLLKVSRIAISSIIRFPSLECACTASNSTQLSGYFCLKPFHFIFIPPIIYYVFIIPYIINYLTQDFRVTVGLPVAQSPPHGSRRAELPHRAPQEYSLP